MKLRCVFATAFLLLTTNVYARIDLGAGRQATVGAYVYDLRKGDVVLADSNYVLQMAQHDFPAIKFSFSSEY